MIQLTRLHGQRFALNCDLIERVEETPDTIVTLVDGTKHVVTESLDEVVDRVRGFRAAVVAHAQQLTTPPAPTPAAAAPADEAPVLRLLPHLRSES